MTRYRRSSPPTTRSTLKGLPITTSIRGVRRVGSWCRRSFASPYPSRMGLRARVQRLHRRCHRGHRRPDGAIRPGIPRPRHQPNRQHHNTICRTQTQLRRRRHHHRARIFASWYSARESRCRRIVLVYRVCISARPPRRPAPARTVCAATTPDKPHLETSALKGKPHNLGRETDRCTGPHPVVIRPIRRVDADHAAESGLVSSSRSGSGRRQISAASSAGKPNMISTSRVTRSAVSASSRSGWSCSN